ncbi:Uncharacterized protein dnl_20410 [Desulfonema limicola]|uniref:Uncharacterized protein n=1 Tax=Desulfonema limicola TaxID=45656 RepID=A0A975B6K5_9BACT|nr:hypothetical protein [Desulfonema limicola]QTA79763.1 Uncharacterized protein dnl_20410 [Desulfonema limicola]
MVSGELLFDLYCQHVDEKSKEKGLSQEETQRIKQVFKNAMANSFMDERQIYLKLTGQEVV